MSGERKVARPADEESPPYGLGVLFVHGIGEPQPGATLAEMGGPLVRWVHEWIGGSPNIEDVVTPSVDAVPIAYAKFADVTFDNADGPVGYAEVDVERRGVATRWLLAESRWAASFHAA